jgi:hypothetical protein
MWALLCIVHVGDVLPYLQQLVAFTKAERCSCIPVVWCCRTMAAGRLPPRIINGKPAPPGRFPYAAILFTRLPYPGETFADPTVFWGCGASLIEGNILATAGGVVSPCPPTPLHACCGDLHA